MDFLLPGEHRATKYHHVAILTIGNSSHQIRLDPIFNEGHLSAPAVGVGAIMLVKNAFYGLMSFV